MTIRETTSILIQQLPTSALAVEGRLTSLDAICLRLLDGILWGFYPLSTFYISNSNLQEWVNTPQSRGRSGTVNGWREWVGVMVRRMPCLCTIG
jgi:hypothetical protein